MVHCKYDYIENRPQTLPQREEEYDIPIPLGKGIGPLIRIFNTEHEIAQFGTYFKLNFP